jgi:hypothetical protein
MRTPLIAGGTVRTHAWTVRTIASAAVAAGLFGPGWIAPRPVHAAVLPFEATLEFSVGVDSVSIVDTGCATLNGSGGGLG